MTHTAVWARIAGAVAAIAVLGAATLAPATAWAQNGGRQRDKNLMRNLGIGLGAGAVYEAYKGRKTEAVLLGGGAAYAGKKYEDARKTQSRDNGNRYGYDGRYDAGRYDNAPSDRRDNGGYARYDGGAREGDRYSPRGGWNDRQGDQRDDRNDVRYDKPGGWDRRGDDRRGDDRRSDDRRDAGRREWRERHDWHRD